jgi:DNA-binding response OmpR family regulator
VKDSYVLVVDDDPDVLGTLTRALTRDGYQVSCVASGYEALEQLKQRTPDLIILDVVMPGLTGIEVCKRIRSNDAYNQVPVLFLSAHGQTTDIIDGLDAGGDDYVVKPFELSELRARVRALLRRLDKEVPARSNSHLEVGPVQLDSDTYRVTVNDNVVQLTSTEHRLLRYMMERPNQALAPSHLLEAVWGYPPNTGDPDLVRAHIRNLRAKIESKNMKFIKTIHGVGYMISED